MRKAAGLQLGFQKGIGNAVDAQDEDPFSSLSEFQKRHALKNYTVVFAPRAGHHSNIAERVALFLRDHGLSRMAVVEQKCAEDIPLYVDGKRHHEDFAGQVDQYRLILGHLKRLTGRPPHLVAICQPGPLPMTTK
jgi:poly-beta-hydroxyalkanoate depolymerase